MIKNILFLFFSCLSLGIYAAPYEEGFGMLPGIKIYTPGPSSEFLNPRQRPDELQAHVNEAFEVLKTKARTVRTTGEDRKFWGCYNGTPCYDPLGIKETELIKAYVHRCYEHGQRLFAFMDVGAGNFSWGSYEGDVHQLIREDLFHLEGATFTLIGVRGEPITVLDGPKALSSKATITFDLANGKTFKGATIERINCGAFRAEDFTVAMEEHGLSKFLGQLDFVISHWGITHFTDPVGSILQIYNGLREGGMVVTSTFYAMYAKDKTLQNKEDLEKLISTSMGVAGRSSPLAFTGYGTLSALIAGKSAGRGEEWLLLLKGGGNATLPLTYYGSLTLNEAFTASRVAQLFRVNENFAGQRKLTPAPFLGKTPSLQESTGTYYNMHAKDRAWFNQFGNLHKKMEQGMQRILFLEKLSQPLLRPFFWAIHFDFEAYLDQLDGHPRVVRKAKIAYPRAKR